MSTRLEYYRSQTTLKGTINDESNGLPRDPFLVLCLEGNEKVRLFSLPRTLSVVLLIQFVVAE